MKFFFKKNTNQEKENGFTLVELLVAASILLTALGAPLYVGIQGVIVAVEAKDKIAATFLAEEGIELVRNLRDTNLLLLLDNPSSLSSWKEGLNVCITPDGCVVGRDLNNFSGLSGTMIYVNPCNSGGCPPLDTRIVSGEERYGYYPGLATPARPSRFTRTIRITNIGVTNNEIRVESKVTWFSRNSPREMVVEEHLYGYDL